MRKKKTIAVNDSIIYLLTHKKILASKITAEPNTVSFIYSCRSTQRVIIIVTVSNISHTKFTLTFPGLEYQPIESYTLSANIRKDFLVRVHSAVHKVCLKRLLPLVDLRSFKTQQTFFRGVRKRQPIRHEHNSQEERKKRRLLKMLHDW